MSAEIIIDAADPDTAFKFLQTSDDTAMIDCRTHAEWDRIGVADISETGRPQWFIEWVSGPGRAPNPAFLDEVLAQAGGVLPGRMFFICRSGARSAAAAHAVAALAEHMGRNVHCTNVVEGFEGHPAAGPRSGWKARGLPCGAYGVERGKT